MCIRDRVDRALPRFRAAADACHGPLLSITRAAACVGLARDSQQQSHAFGLAPGGAALGPGWCCADPLHRSGNHAVAWRSDHGALLGGRGPSCSCRGNVYQQNLNNKYKRVVNCYKACLKISLLITNSPKQQAQILGRFIALSKVDINIIIESQINISLDI